MFYPSVSRVQRESDRRCRTYLNLVDIHLPVLFLHLLVCHLHCVDGGHRVPQVLSRHRSGLHVERLLGELRELRLVHPLLLQHAERALLHCRLPHTQAESEGGVQAVAASTHLAGPVAQLRHLLFVARELTVELLDLYFDGAYPRICLAVRA
jgi:hypothetical protein